MGRHHAGPGDVPAVHGGGEAVGCALELCRQLDPPQRQPPEPRRWCVVSLIRATNLISPIRKLGSRRPLCPLRTHTPCLALLTDVVLSVCSLRGERQAGAGRRSTGRAVPADERRHARLGVAMRLHGRRMGRLGPDRRRRRVSTDDLSARNHHLNGIYRDVSERLLAVPGPGPRSGRLL